MERQMLREVNKGLTVRATTTIINKALVPSLHLPSLCGAPSSALISGVLPHISGVVQRTSTLKSDNHSSFSFLSERIWALEGLE